MPVYVASLGPKSLQIAGELGDGVMLIGIHPEIMKWNIEQVEKGAERAGREVSDLDLWARTMIYVAPSKEEARREVASFAATCDCDAWRSLLRRDTPEVADLRNRMEEVQPGILEEIKAVYEAYDPYQHMVTDAPHAKAVTQRVIDTFLLTGTPEDICEQIDKLPPLGVNNVSTVLFTIIDKRGMMREIGDSIMPFYRN